MELERCGYSRPELAEYTKLFAACFPEASKLSNLEYLHWLYAENPNGAVVGYNAWEGERLAAHYVCVPMKMLIDGRERRVLLSLNTATHPDFQGKGLFTRLADATYAAGAAEGFSGVYGVANANSTPGFLRKLGFVLISPLESRVGVGQLGRFDWPGIDRYARFRQSWTPESLAWRIANPVAPVMCHPARGGEIAVSAQAGRAGIRAWAELPGEECRLIGTKMTRSNFGLRVWLGLLPAGLGSLKLYPRLPDRFRPSPLNLIFRGLDGLTMDVAADQVFFNFLDFDAF